MGHTANTVRNAWEPRSHSRGSRGIFGSLAVAVQCRLASADQVPSSHRRITRGASTGPVVRVNADGVVGAATSWVRCNRFTRSGSYAASQMCTTGTMITQSDGTPGESGAGHRPISALSRQRQRRRAGLSVPLPRRRELAGTRRSNLTGCRSTDPSQRPPVHRWTRRGRGTGRTARPRMIAIISGRSSSSSGFSTPPSWSRAAAGAIPRAVGTRKIPIHASGDGTTRVTTVGNPARWWLPSLRRPERSRIR